MRAMRMHVLALDDVFDLGLSAILDVFDTANELIQLSGLDVPRFEIRTVGVRRAVRTSHGALLRRQLHVGVKELRQGGGA